MCKFTKKCEHLYWSFQTIITDEKKVLIDNTVVGLLLITWTNNRLSYTLTTSPFTKPFTPVVMALSYGFPPIFFTTWFVISSQLKCQQACTMSIKHVSKCRIYRAFFSSLLLVHFHFPMFVFILETCKTRPLGHLQRRNDMTCITFFDYE